MSPPGSSRLFSSQCRIAGQAGGLLIGLVHIDHTGVLAVCVFMIILNATKTPIVRYLHAFQKRVHAAHPEKTF